MAVVDNPELLAALKLHEAANTAVEGTDWPDEVPPELVDVETRAFVALAAVPCGDDAQFFQKLRYMLRHQKAAYGPSWTGSYAKEILTALSLHLLPSDEPGEGERCATSADAEKLEALDGILHVPSRADSLEGLDEHLRMASALSRALWLAAHYSGVDAWDERDRDAILELSSAVADHASSALFVFLKKGGDRG